MKRLCNNMRTRRTRSGFTLLELMAAIFISILIIGALYAIFSRVQEVFRIGHNQTRVLERGRAIMEVITRDLERMHAAINPENGAMLLGPSFENLSARDFGVPGWVSGASYAAGQVVYDKMSREYYACLMDHVATADNAPGGAAWQRVPPENYRIGVEAGAYEGSVFTSGDFRFLGKDRHWHAVGYGLYSPEAPNYPNQLVGSLYRFHKSDELMGIDQIIRNHNLNSNAGDYQKIADGVVHLRLRAVSAEDPARALWHEPVFSGAHVPLYVEVELGLLEDGLVREMEAAAEQHMPGTQDGILAQHNVLKENLQRIHMFRQIVPIRNSRHFGYGPSKAAVSDISVFRRRGINTQVEGKGDRFVFIIDSSGSMGGEKYTMVKQALMKTLDNLDTSKSFYIYFYDHRTEKMGDADMLPANQGNKDRIKAWVNDFALMGGSTDPAGALQDVFSTKNPSTIWLLTDGHFNGFDANGVIDYVNLIRQMNPGSKVRINTIGIGRSMGAVDSRLAVIAQENDGTYTFYDASH